MKSPKAQDRLDAIFTEYAIDHIDWPDTDEDLDQFLDEVEAGESLEPDSQQLLFDLSAVEQPASQVNSVDCLSDIVRRAYLQVFAGHSIDRLIADPEPNASFVQACWKLGAQATQYELTHVLLNARKNKVIGKVEGVRRYSVPRHELDKYLFAAEFALRLIQDKEYYENQRSVSLDRIVCDPTLSTRFVDLASGIVPGFSALDYRWAAFSIRKGQNRRATKQDLPIPIFQPLGRRNSLRLGRVDQVAGFFWLNFKNADLYIGHTENLRTQIERLLDSSWDAISEVGDLLGLGNPRDATFAVSPYPDVSSSNREAVKTQLVRTKEPKLNVVAKGLRVA